MASKSLTITTWKGYYSSTNWLQEQNCYCDPVYIYFNYPAAAGQTTGRTFSITLPVLYSKSITSSYEASLYIDGVYKAYTSGSISLNSSIKTLTLTFSGITASASGGSGYVWLDFGYGTVQLYSGWSYLSGSMTYTAITKCGAPTSITGYQTNNTSSTRVLPNKNFTFTWNGASSGVSNTINNYCVGYRYGSGNWNYIDTASTATSYTFSPSTSYRGSTLQFAVQTRGSGGSDYYSDWAHSSYYTINSLPPAPSVSVDESYYPSIGGTRKFTATVGADANGDTVTIQYSEDSAFSTYATYSSAVSKTINNDLSSYTLYFRSYDGYEYSSTVSKTVYRNTPPTISNLGISYTSLPGTDSNTTYVRSLTVNPTVSKTVTYNWTLYYNSSASSSGATSVSLSTTASNTFSLTSYKGKYVKLKLVVSDGYDTASKESGWYLVPTSPSSATGVSVYTASASTNVIAAANSILYTGNSIYVNWTVPAVGATQLARYSYVVLQKQSGTTWTNVKTYTSTASTTTQINYSNNYTLPSDITYGTTYRIIVYVQEKFPGTETASYIYETYTLTRAPQPSLSGSSPLTIEDVEVIRPTSGQTGERGASSAGSLTFAHPTAVNSNLGVKWSLTAKLNGESITLMKDGETTTGITTSTSGSTVTHTFTNVKWKELFAKPTWNNRYTATIGLSLENSFGDKINDILTTTLDVDYREAPQWASSNSRLTEQIKYTSTIIGNSLTGVGSTTSNAAYLVNAGEAIQLTIPNITDANNDTNKTVYIERGIATDWTNVLDTIKSATNWTSIGSFKPSEATTYSYTIPDISQDAFYVFRAWVKGTNTLASTDNYIDASYRYAYSPTVVRVCRSQNPTVEITSISDPSGGGTFTIKPTITLMGSTLYATYKNWERENVTASDGSSSTRDITVSAEICLDGLFSTGSTTTKTILSNYAKEYSSVNSSATYSSITNTDFAGKIVFARVTATINTGYGVLKTSTSPIYTFYAISPTVSHRSHQIGINTNSFETTDILHLSSASGKNTIRATGTTSSGQITSLKLDINSLALSASNYLNMTDTFLNIQGKNPYVMLTDTTDGVNAITYLQAYQGQIGIGSGWPTSIKVDTGGNLAVVGTVKASSIIDTVIDGGTW